jgi:predicted glycosyltransferase
VGLGHVVRGAALADALSPCYEVRLIGGWMTALKSSLEEAYCCVPLIPLRLDLSRKVNHPLEFEEDCSCLLSLQPDTPASDAIEARKQRIMQEIVEFKPDVIITEYYPFGRWVLGLELLPAIDYARRQGSRILCSIRDVLKPPSENSRWRHQLGTEYEAGFVRYYRRAVELLNLKYDALLVHSDRQVVKLEDSMVEAKDITIPIIYTGYISTSINILETDKEYHKAKSADDPYIVISAGGGYGEFEFFRTWLPVLAQVRDTHLGSTGTIVALAGPLMEDLSYLRLKEICSVCPRTELRRYCNRFQELIDGAALSVSRAGYNTAFNLLRSHAPALLIPASHLSDQPLRAHRFDALGIASCCDPDARPAEGMNRVLAAMNRTFRRSMFDTHGAVHTLEAIQRILLGEPRS